MQTLLDQYEKNLTHPHILMLKNGEAGRSILNSNASSLTDNDVVVLPRSGSLARRLCSQLCD